ncbi:MAG: hypothetical protein UX57_C0006G0020 [Candidatus Uhrbacteria bacterium GW2011_GWE2_46_68]|uniref:DUF4012 domain-containing protein n=2 Tax=Candidatus Uhriibacteriota TaxID=1752732 RepID=A0A0G1T6Y2_9BACT|nr:MAG: hypothetical protein UX45_C0008G0006 [Candidatus Uhrbacteria bacterium GW2011_GWF2_46_218]KKU41110.1 MAG: hypothetical protein UX57_C0006G0020 [Candidatus Uhrbacteria bacterium GW2011_GWE2_46_68]
MIVVVCASFFLVVLCACVGFAGWAFATTQSIMQEAKHAKEAVAVWDFVAASDALDAIQKTTVRAEHAVDFFGFLAPFPWIGDQVTGLAHTLEAGGYLLEALQNLCGVGEDMVRLSGLSADLSTTQVEGTFAEVPRETKRAVLMRLSEASSDFAQASAQLSIVREEMQQWGSALWLVSSLSTFLTLLDQLDEASQSLHNLQTFATILPEFGGLEEQKTFLLLFLNNTELRPGGGFIGTYGLARVQDGDFVSVQTKDVYALDQLAVSSLAAPIPLQTYNATPFWYMRDANWSPDFAVSALHIIERFIAEGQSLSEEQKMSVPTAMSVHGVIGLTTTFVSDILVLTGPLTVSGQTFTAENFADAMEYQVEVGYTGQGIPSSQRKEILADVVESLLYRLYELPASDWPALLDIVSANFSQKQLAFYSADQEVEEALLQAGWAGRVLSSSVDTQMVVDANLASLKSDPAVDRDMTYEVFQNTKGDWIGRTTIIYAHRGSFDWKTTRYRTYTRLYVPFGTKLIDTKGSLVNDRLLNPSQSEGVVDVGTDLGLTYFGAFTSVEPGETQTLVFEYLLSDGVVEAIENGSYTLTFFKQMGASDHNLHLALDFGNTIFYATPSEERLEWGNETYLLNTILDQDKIFEVLFD